MSGKINYLYEEILFFIAALFGLSGLIGVYFWRKGDQTTPEETLLGEVCTIKENENIKYEIWEMFYVSNDNLVVLSLFGPCQNTKS